MPRGDRTGPAGQGPLTGRGAGRCAGNNTPGYGFFGRGRGFGRGLGFGFGNYSQTPYDQASEKSWLESGINALKNQLLNLEKRRDEMDK